MPPLRLGRAHELPRPPPDRRQQGAPHQGSLSRFISMTSFSVVGSDEVLIVSLLLFLHLSASSLAARRSTRRASSRRSAGPAL